MGIFSNIFPSRHNFYEMLINQAGLTLNGIECLYAYIEETDPVLGKKVVELEQTADEARRLIIDTIDQTFITPFDREDIFALSCAIDDIIDYARTTVEEMEIYELQSGEELKEMVKVILEATNFICKALDHLEKHPAIATEHAVRAKKLENDLETRYRISLAKLVKNEDFSYVFKMREVYRHLSNLADKIDLAANIISHVIVKQT